MRPFFRSLALAEAIVLIALGAYIQTSYLWLSDYASTEPARFIYIYNGRINFHWTAEARGTGYHRNFGLVFFQKSAFLISDSLTHDCTYDLQIPGFTLIILGALIASPWCLRRIFRSKSSPPPSPSSGAKPVPNPPPPSSQQ